MSDDASKASPVSLRLLTAEDVRRLLPMPTAIALMAEAFAALSLGRATVPVRTRLDAPETGCQTLVMPSYLPEAGQMGLKVVSVQPANPARGLPTIHGLMLVLDAETGRPAALMDAEALTAIRTGAATGLATDRLAHPEAQVAAVFGTGAQAQTQLEAVCAVRSIERIYVFSRTPETARRFAEVMTERLGVPVVPADGAARLREADIICTATTATRPVFAAADVRPGAHINAIGAYRADMAEVPPETVRAATVIVDHRASCLAEAGDLLQAFETREAAARHIHAELGELVEGRVRGRGGFGSITLFKSVGNAVQDLAAAGYVVRQAEAMNLGTTVRL